MKPHFTQRERTPAQLRAIEHVEAALKDDPVDTEQYQRLTERFNADCEALGIPVNGPPLGKAEPNSASWQIRVEALRAASRITSSLIAADVRMISDGTEVLPPQYTTSLAGIFERYLETGER